MTANLNIHPEDPVSTKTDHRELHKVNIHERAATDTTLITDTNIKKNWANTILNIFPSDSDKYYQTTVASWEGW